MGYYLQTPGTVTGKAKIIMEQYHAKVLPAPPRTLKTLPQGQALICVVSNGAFEAAAFCYDESELHEFTQPHDPRPKTWLHMDWSKAVELSGLVSPS